MSNETIKELTNHFADKYETTLENLAKGEDTKEENSEN